MAGLVKEFEKALRWSGWLSPEHRDYILCKEIYHCTPTQLEEVPEFLANLHFQFLMAERKQERIEAKKAEQKAKLRK